MNSALFLLAFTMFWKSSESILCYKCIPEKSPYGSLPCSQFNYSKEFVADCRSSTMCFKRETTLHLNNGIVSISVERGCAAQTMSGDQRKINGKWTSVTEVYEVYEESCKEYKSDYERATQTIHCYCREDLCNSATNVKLCLGTLFAVIVGFLAS